MLKPNPQRGVKGSAFGSVLAYPCFYNNTQDTEKFLKNRNLFPIDLELKKSKIKVSIVCQVKAALFQDSTLSAMFSGE